MEKKFNIGVDIGGTKIALGLVNSNGEILEQRKFLTRAERKPEVVIEELIQEIEELINQGEVSREEIYSIGLGVPGTVDLETKEVILAPNIYWRNVPLGEKLEAVFPEQRICADYDTNAAVLGELKACDDSINSLFYITISTGVGAGVIINGELLRGSGNTAGEIGHIVMEKNGRKCTCGSQGCLQQYAKGPAIAEQAEKRIKEGAESALSEILEEEGKITCEQVSKAAWGGDELACSVLMEAAEYTGIALANVITLIKPDLIIIGGGVVKCGSLFLDPVNKITQENCYPPARGDVEIKTTDLWEKAGIIGASLLHTTLGEKDSG